MIFKRMNVKKTRIISIMLVLLVLLSGCQSKETSKNESEVKNDNKTESSSSFSVRGGITFGMSSEEVRRIEKENGVEVKSFSDLIEGQKGSSDGNFSLFSTTDLSIAGIDGGSLNYSFKDNKLFEIGYSWNLRWDDTYECDFQLNEDTKIRNQKANEFEILSKALSDKYTKIGYIPKKNEVVYVNLNKEGEYNDFYGPAVWDTRSDYYTIIGFNQFIIPCEDYYVEACLQSDREEYHGVGIQITKNAQSVKYVLELNYRIREKEQIDQLLTEIHEKEEQRNTDL